MVVAFPAESASPVSSVVEAGWPVDARPDAVSGAVGAGGGVDATCPPPEALLFAVSAPGVGRAAMTGEVLPVLVVVGAGWGRATHAADPRAAVKPRVHGLQAEGAAAPGWSQYRPVAHAVHAEVPVTSAL